MSKTRSEELFEQYCKRNGYSVEAIPTGQEKSSDYSIRACGHEIIVEVKELRPNDDDLRRIKEWRERGATGGGDRPGRRAHELIKRAARQLGRYRDLGVPCVALLYDNIAVDGYRPGTPNRHFDPAFIDFGMYGLQTVILSVSREQIRSIGDGRGGKRQATASERTYLSAVAVLYEGEVPEQNFLVVYHNYFAAHPLPREVFSGRLDHHFRKPGHPDQTPQEWTVA
jgi:hypothetical protein